MWQTWPRQPILLDIFSNPNTLSTTVRSWSVRHPLSIITVKTFARFFLDIFFSPHYYRKNKVLFFALFSFISPLTNILICFVTVSLSLELSSSSSIIDLGFSKLSVCVVIMTSSEEVVEVTVVKAPEAGGGKLSRRKIRKKDAGVDGLVKWERFLPKIALRVLLVEADDSTRQIIAALLRKCSYRG